MRNLTMLMDYYELTMSNGYFEKGFKDKMVVFDMFYRKNPDNGGFVVSAGLEQLIEYIEDMHFSREDIEFLRSKGEFSEGFLQYLEDFKFTGNIDALPVYYSYQFDFLLIFPFFTSIYSLHSFFFSKKSFSS